jgi:hypothetical protein
MSSIPILVAQDDSYPSTNEGVRRAREMWDDQ